MLPNIVASLHLLDMGNLEVEWCGSVAKSHKYSYFLSQIHVRLDAIAQNWDNPELQALLDKFIAADFAGDLP